MILRITEAPTVNDPLRPPGMESVAQGSADCRDLSFWGFLGASQPRAL